MCVHGDDFMVESRIDVVQDAKAMSEHKVDIEVLAIIGPGQNIEAKIVKRVLSGRPDGITRAQPSDELTWKRAKAISSAGGTATYLVLNRLDIAYNFPFRSANRDVSKPRVRTKARLKRIARYLLGEPEFIWTFPYHEVPLKSVRKADAEWNGHDNQDQKCFSCVVARPGDHVIDVECAKQDMISSSALQSEFYALTTDGANDIRTENVCVPSKDREADLRTKYLDRDRIKRCVTKMEMMFTGASAGKQLPVVSGTGVIFGEDLIEGQSWTIGVVLLVTVGVVLLSCACIVHDSHLPTGEQ